MVDLKLAENLSPPVEVTDYCSSIVLELHAVGENGLGIFVTLGYFCVDICFFEGFEVVVICHSVCFKFLCVEGDLPERPDVVQGSLRLPALNLIVLIHQKVDKNLVFTYEF